MKHYAIERSSRFPLVQVTLTDEFSVNQDLSILAREAVALFEQEPSPVFFLMDMAALNITISEAFIAASASTKADGGMLRHRNLREFIVVSPTRLVEYVTKSLGEEIFGQVPVKVFATMGEALSYVHVHTPL